MIATKPANDKIEKEREIINLYKNRIIILGKIANINSLTDNNVNRKYIKNNSGFIINNGFQMNNNATSGLSIISGFQIIKIEDILLSKYNLLLSLISYKIFNHSCFLSINNGFHFNNKANLSLINNNKFQLNTFDFKLE